MEKYSRVKRKEPEMLEALAEAIGRYTEELGGSSSFVTAIEGFILLRSDQEKPITHRIYKPALCITVQGAKEAIFGTRRFDYKAGQALVVRVDTPGIGRVVEASPNQPYLGVVLGFDQAALRDVVERVNLPQNRSGSAEPGLFVMDLDYPLTDCLLRMVRLLDTPDAIPVVAPLFLREIYYWLLTGPYGGEIAEIGLVNRHAQEIISAVHSLRDRFAESIRIEDLAQAAHMSPSAFHRQFKALTLMTPLQYQKQLRLIEARRLMTAEAANVETAAFHVGYESPSQFSREYCRLFGAPPRRDVVGRRMPAL